MRTSANPHQAYADLVQIVARFGPEAHISVAIAAGTDACASGTRLIKLSDRSLQRRVSVNAHGNVPT